MYVCVDRVGVEGRGGEGIGLVWIGVEWSGLVWFELAKRACVSVGGSRSGGREGGWIDGKGEGKTEREKRIGRGWGCWVLAAHTPRAQLSSAQLTQSPFIAKTIHN